MSTFRYKLLIEYDGTPYQGWQSQLSGQTIQDKIVEAVNQVSSCKELYGSGRTDAGVHAWGQVAHLDLPEAWDAYKLKGALNAHLKDEAITIHEIEEAPKDFHARYGACHRHYIYRLTLQETPLCLQTHRTWRVTPALDILLMTEALTLFQGTHDFQAFRSAQCQGESSEKTVHTATLFQQHKNLYVHVSSPSFLHHQVRFMVGAARCVGEGKMSLEMLRNILNHPEEAAIHKWPLAPACGLYLARVDYTPDIPFEIARFLGR